MTENYKKFDETTLSNFQARYGEAIPDNTFPVNEFIENILARKTVRKFLDKQIDPKLFEKLIACAQSAPTSSMIQPWSIIVLKDKKQKFKFFQSDNINHTGLLTSPSLKEPADPENFSAITGCDIFIIWLVDCSLMDKIFTDESLTISHPELETLRKSAYESARNSSFEIRSICDAVIAAQTFCLAAESMGLGTMYCGSIKTMDLKTKFNIPDHAMPLFGICVGYPDTGLNNTVKPRLPQRFIVHNETYQSKDFNDVKLYNKLLELFYKTHQLSRDWFYRIIARTQISQTSEKYRELIDKYGFKFK
jgi:nitroreductase